MSIKQTIQVDAVWVRVIKLIQAAKYGECRIIFQGGIPIRLESVVKQVKLDAPQDADETMEQFRTIDLSGSNG